VRKAEALRKHRDDTHHAANDQDGRHRAEHDLETEVLNVRPDLRQVREGRREINEGRSRSLKRN